MSPVSTIAAGGRVMPARASLLGRPLGWTKAVTGDRLFASWAVSERQGASMPLGGVEPLRRKERFARLIHRCGRVLADLWSAPPAAAISSVAWSPRRMV